MLGEGKHFLNRGKDKKMALIILQQILTMALYMICGYMLYKTGKITDAGSKSIANLLPWVIIPSTLINSFLTEYSAEKMRELLISFGMAALTLLIAMVIGFLLFRNSGIECFAASFSNAGFIGIPLVQATVGSEGVFYLSGVLILLNLLQWTYGIWLLTREKKDSSEKTPKTTVKSVLFSPIVICAIVGILIFVTGSGTKLPPVLNTFIGGLAQVNAPVAMIVLGIYLARTKISELFTTRRLYLVSSVRLLLIPAVTLLVFAVLPVPYMIKITMLIAGAAPVGANVAVYAQLYDADYGYACQTVTQSTLLSILTLPAVIWVAEKIMAGA